MSEINFRQHISRVKNQALQLGDLVADLNKFCEGKILFTAVGVELHARLKPGVQLAAEVEKSCDVITREREDGSVEWLKNRDNPLPEPTDAAL